MSAGLQLVIIPLINESTYSFFKTMIDLMPKALNEAACFLSWPPVQSYTQLSFMQEPLL